MRSTEAPGLLLAILTPWMSDPTCRGSFAGDVYDVNPMELVKRDKQTSLKRAALLGFLFIIIVFNFCSNLFLSLERIIIMSNVMCKHSILDVKS